MSFDFLALIEAGGRRTRGTGYAPLVNALERARLRVGAVKHGEKTRPCATRSKMLSAINIASSVCE